MTEKELRKKAMALPLNPGVYIMKNADKDIIYIGKAKALKNRVTLGLDPGYRTGCKIAVVDGTGKVLDTGVIYPTPP